jgi:predicted nucleic acid-binding protein
MPLPAGYLFDTNILLALIRGNDLGKYLVATYGLVAAARPFLVSVVSVGENYSLARKFGWGAGKVAAMHSLLGRLAVLDVNHPDVLQAYAEIDAACEAAGRPMGKNDVWIAATARALNATLLTTDQDFDFIHGTWIDREWVDPSSKLPP